MCVREILTVINYERERPREREPDRDSDSLSAWVREGQTHREKISERDIENDRDISKVREIILLQGRRETRRKIDRIYLCVCV